MKGRSRMKRSRSQHSPWGLWQAHRDQARPLELNTFHLFSIKRVYKVNSEAQSNFVLLLYHQQHVKLEQNKQTYVCIDKKSVKKRKKWHVIKVKKRKLFSLNAVFISSLCNSLRHVGPSPNWASTPVVGRSVLVLCTLHCSSSGLSSSLEQGGPNQHAAAHRCVNMVNLLMFYNGQRNDF